MSQLLVDNIAPTSGSIVAAYNPNVFYWPGAHVQTVFNRVETRMYAWAPNNDGNARGDYGANYSYDGGFPIRMLDISIAPTSERSWIHLEWNIFYETNENVLFNILRDGNIISTPGVGDVVDAYVQGKWVGAGVSRYDNNGDSTPSYIQLNWIDNPSTIETVTYSVAIKSSNGNAYDFTLNATLSNYQNGGDAYEQGVSFAIANEIAR
jgi:hypothetical protein